MNDFIEIDFAVQFAIAICKRIIPGEIWLSSKNFPNKEDWKLLKLLDDDFQDSDGNCCFLFKYRDGIVDRTIMFYFDEFEKDETYFNLHLKINKSYSFTEGDKVTYKHCENSVGRSFAIIKNVNLDITKKIFYYTALVMDHSNGHVKELELIPNQSIYQATEDDIAGANVTANKFKLTVGDYGFDEFHNTFKPGDIVAGSKGMYYIVNSDNGHEIRSNIHIDINAEAAARYKEEIVTKSKGLKLITSDTYNHELVCKILDKYGYWFNYDLNYGCDQIDVQKGDILMEDTEAEHKNPFIFDHWIDGMPVAVCGLGEFDQLIICKDKDKVWTDYRGIVKATPDQVEKLLSKIRGEIDIYLTRDDTGLLQIWKDKPEKFQTEAGVIFGDHNRIGIEVNDILGDQFKDETKSFCMHKYLV